jgi:hypothetical protein
MEKRHIDRRVRQMEAEGVRGASAPPANSTASNSPCRLAKERVTPTLTP